MGHSPPVGRGRQLVFVFARVRVGIVFTLQNTAVATVSLARGAGAASFTRLRARLGELLGRREERPSTRGMRRSIRRHARNGGAGSRRTMSSVA